MNELLAAVLDSDTDPRERRRHQARARRQQYKNDPVLLERQRKWSRESRRRRYAADPEKFKQKAREWRVTHPEKKGYKDPVRQKASHLKHRYGLTLEIKQQMLCDQKDACAICQQPLEEPQAHVDHSHADGHVRGLLCTHCNKGLGCFKDNPTLLEAAIVYLDRDPKRTISYGE